MAVDLSKRHLLRISGNKALPIRPPYNGGEEHFVDHCTRCKECVVACETNIISIGSGGFPLVDFTNDECTFCQRCSDVCPTDALDKIKYDAFTAQITIDKTCLAANSIYCQSCRDVCDEEAITFDFFSQSIPIPQINNDACTSCGACISSCPQTAIQITINEVT